MLIASLHTHPSFHLVMEDYVIGAYDYFIDTDRSAWLGVHHTPTIDEIVRIIYEREDIEDYLISHELFVRGGYSRMVTACEQILQIHRLVFGDYEGSIQNQGFEEVW